MTKKLLYHSRSDSESFVKKLRSMGMKIGDRTTVLSSMTSEIDLTRPYLIEIGDDVQITRGCTILTHGYDWSVLKGVYGDILGSAGKVTIGNNVFIGMNTTILKGVTIGNNVIIGANSLCNKDISANTVVAGNPAKVIMSIEDYYKKRQDAQIQEAQELINTYYQTYRKLPEKKDLHEFFWLFSDDPDKLDPCYKQMMELLDNEDFSNNRMRAHTKAFDNFESCVQALLDQANSKKA